MGFVKVLKIAGGALGAIGGVVGTAEVITNVVESYSVNNVHEINYTDTYTINGVEVSEAEFRSWLATNGSTLSNNANEVRITKNDFDSDGIARLAPYVDIDFDADGYYAMKVLSNRISNIHYEYSQGYMSYTDGVTYLASDNPGYIYQNINSELQGLSFSIGVPNNTNVDLIFDVNNPSKGFYIFNFEKVPNHFPLTFEDVFEEITLTLA